MRFYVLFFLVISAIRPAHAEEVDMMALMLSKIVGTQSVLFEPQVRNGDLIGCTFSYDALVRDWKYRNGGFLKVSGSLGILGPDGSFGAMQKLVVNHIDYSGPTPQIVPSRPSRLYMRDQNYRTNLDSLVNSAESDSPGSVFSVFSVSPTMEIILAGIEHGEIIVAFNQLDGESDIELPIDLDVASMDQEGNRTRSNDARKAFLKCLLTLSKQVQQ